MSNEMDEILKSIKTNGFTEKTIKKIFSSDFSLWDKISILSNKNLKVDEESFKLFLKYIDSGYSLGYLLLHHSEITDKMIINNLENINLDFFPFLLEKKGLNKKSLKKIINYFDKNMKFIDQQIKEKFFNNLVSKYKIEPELIKKYQEYIYFNNLKSRNLTKELIFDLFEKNFSIYSVAKILTDEEILEYLKMKETILDKKDFFTELLLLLVFKEKNNDDIDIKLFRYILEKIDYSFFEKDSYFNYKKKDSLEFIFKNINSLKDFFILLNQKNNVETLNNFFKRNNEYKKKIVSLLSNKEEWNNLVLFLKNKNNVGNINPKILNKLIINDIINFVAEINKFSNMKKVMKKIKQEILKKSSNQQINDMIFKTK